MLDETETVISISPPLHRRHMALDIKLEVDEQWNAVPPFKQIRLEDGRMVTVKVVLVSQSGERFEPDLYGAAGGIDARFDGKVPRDAAIVECRLSSDTPLTCRRVIWQDWTPL